MKKLCLLAVVVLVCFISACATGLSSYQGRELEGYKQKGMAIEEKSTGTAAGLGLLFGGGSFYTRNYGLGVVNLLFWPLSICWDPISGTNGAETINYYATKENVRRLKEKETKLLDRELEDKKITERDYILKKRILDEKYAIES